MSENIFNPTSFLDTMITEANDTKLLPIPAGVYPATIEKVTVRQWTGKADPTKSGLCLDVIWNLDDPNLQATLERDKISVKQGIMLDLTEAGGLDSGKGKNINLGRLREGVGCNTPGQPFSFNMLPGRQAKVDVSQRVDGENIYNDVKSVAKL